MRRYLLPRSLQSIRSRSGTSAFLDEQLMKTVLLWMLILIGLQGRVAAQGWFTLDNSLSNNGYCLDHPGNYYTGGGGVEVWEANAATDAQIGMINSAPSGVSAYELLGGSGFKLECTYQGSSLFSDGTAQLEPVINFSRRHLPA